MNDNRMPVWAVVPATGIGSRMQADRPKQYLELGGSTILERTLDALLAHPDIDGVVLVLNAQDEFWVSLDYQPRKPLLTAVGGAERYHSVYNGLKLLHQHLQSDALVLIHDAVRPFLTQNDLGRLIAAASQGDDGAILAVELTDTLKVADGDRTIQATRSREQLWRAFTPQAFRLRLILKALEKVKRESLTVTDDASAMELLGYHPRLIPCDQRNFKITRREDLELAEMLLGR